MHTSRLLPAYFVTLTNFGVHRNCCDPPDAVYNYDNDWDGGLYWINELFNASFEDPGERAPRIKNIDQLYIPGLMTANKRLRTYWVSACATRGKI